MNKKKKLDISRIAFCTLILCVAAIALLAIYANQVQDLLVKISEKGEGKVPNLIWFLERIALGAPVIILCGILTALYSNRENYVPVKSQREMFWVSVLTAVFTYAVMMTFVKLRSRGVEVPEGEELEEIKTLWDITYKWFFVQVIPFLIMITYHGVRADSEEKELKELADE